MTRFLLVLFIVAQAGISAQSPVATPAIDIPKADLDATLARAPAAGVMDQQIRVVDIGKYNVAVGVLHRSAKPARQGAISHSQVTEIYHMMKAPGRSSRAARS